VNLFTPKPGAEHDLLFNKLASVVKGICLLIYHSTSLNIGLEYMVPSLFAESHLADRHLADSVLIPSLGRQRGDETSVGEMIFDEKTGHRRNASKNEATAGETLLSTKVAVFGR
jgi:hypothetical protein